jgi:hypothetical protein
MSRKMIALLCLMLIGGFMFLLPQESAAVPAWSRLTGSTCNSCHATPTWQLTPFGLSFLRNGHRLEATPAKFDLGIQKWDNYLSLVWKFRAYDEEDQRVASQLEQHSFSIYTGGALSERFSYFTEMYLSENTGKTAEGGSFTTATDGVVQEDGSRKKLAEAFIQYNQPIGKGFLAVRAGEILPEIIHVFGAGARSGEQRALVLNDKANAANPYKPFNRQQGVDAKLNLEPVEIAVGVVNGSDYTIERRISNATIRAKKRVALTVGCNHAKGTEKRPVGIFRLTVHPSTRLEYQGGRWLRCS